ncbi:MAG: acetylxylan esterase [Planctomycetota bacterium]|jgi:cephalosporin-C deacetylase
MAININTVDVGLPSEAYDWRTWPPPYVTTGILDKNHYALRFGYAAIARAYEVLAARPEVDVKTIHVKGSSQGGGLTLVAAGLLPKAFVSATARKPGLCRLDWNLDHLNPPFFPIAATEQGKPMIHQTLKYFLPCHFTRKITCPIEVSLGIYDDVTPGVSVFCAYNAIPANTKKRLKVDANAGH